MYTIITHRDGQSFLDCKSYCSIIDSHITAFKKDLYFSLYEALVSSERRTFRVLILEDGMTALDVYEGRYIMKEVSPALQEILIEYVNKILALIPSESSQIHQITPLNPLKNTPQESGLDTSYCDGNFSVTVQEDLKI